jgi:hypothetical protein
LIWSPESYLVMSTDDDLSDIITCTDFTGVNVSILSCILMVLNAIHVSVLNTTVYEWILMWMLRYLFMAYLSANQPSSLPLCVD